MKGILKVLGILVMVFSLSSCVVHEQQRGRAHLPPGHAKKIYGGSARQYAPGHMKKKNYYKVDRKGPGYKKHKGNHRGRH
ncbi:hypothetical protein [Chryseobacterium sp.]|uniref:hypothetical protein n=1 Tax=Chryseobacterium sp. TaxID=1871047 RepID=UPI00388D9D44